VIFFFPFIKIFARNGEWEKATEKGTGKKISKKFRFSGKKS
jgi:hypothetical protein